MNSKSTVTLKKLVMAALFAALACVATMSIKIPTPGTSGYIHPGDAIVILAGVVLGPAWGFLAGGIGSAMADLLGGYFVYVPITFVIKGLVSLCSALLYRKVGRIPRAVTQQSSSAVLLISFSLPAVTACASTLSTEPAHSQAFRRTWSRESVD